MLIGFHLLDRQIVDRDGEPVGKVDDVELTVGEDGAVRVTALLVGPRALGERIGGMLGRWMAGRLSPAPRRIDMDLVAGVSSAVNLSVRRELLPDAPIESWLRDHLIARIPGSDHES
jgi:sporulation protein YlmC with PRC-barrel domain